jgi:hypothetical protein
MTMAPSLSMATPDPGIRDISNARRRHRGARMVVVTFDQGRQ